MDTLGTKNIHKRTYRGALVPRNALRPGLLLVSYYKGVRRDAEVIEGPDGALLIRTGGEDYTSLSAAARAICQSETNGWNFWRLAE